jgi:hypothetical protein
MAINDRTIQWNLQVAGAPQAVNDMTSVTGAMTNMDDASRLATAIGGTAGLAAGGLVAALSLAVDWFVRTRDEAEKTKNEFIAAGIAAIKLADTISEIDKARAKASRRALDVAEERDIIEDIEAINTKIKETEDEHFKLMNGKLDIHGKELKVMFKKQRTVLDTLAADKRTLETRLDIKRAEEASVDIAEETTEWEIEKQKVLEKQLKTTKAITNEWKNLITSLAADGEVTDLFEMFDPKEADDPFKIVDEATDRQQLAIGILKDLEDANKEVVKGTNDIALAAKGAFDVVATSGANAFMELVKGNEISGAAIIEGIGDQLYSKGIAHVLEAAAMAWIPGLQGNAGGLAAAGAVEMVTGLAMGAAGAAAGGGSAGGGGGAGGGGSGLAPGRPTPVAQGILDKRQEESTVIHVHTLTPTVEAGEAIDRAWIAARTKRGKYAMGMKA